MCKICFQVLSPTYKAAEQPTFKRTDGIVVLFIEMSHRRRKIGKLYANIVKRFVLAISLDHAEGLWLPAATK